MSYVHTGFLPPVQEQVFVSDWRRNLEAKLREPLPKYWKASEVKAVEAKPERVKRVARPREPRPPRVRKRPPGQVVRTKFCSDCGKGLNAQNRIGKCKGCCPKMRILDATPKPTCIDCGCVINRDNIFGRCRSHSRKLHQQAFRDRKAEKRKAKHD